MGVKSNKRGNGNRKSKRSVILFFTGVALGLLIYFIVTNTIRVLEKEAYPLEYIEELIAASSEYGLDPRLVASVINTESRFLKDAVSVDGAVGLMQLLPTTAEWIAWKRSIDYDENSLYDPKTNMDYGCWLLRFLLDRYDGNTEYALIAYNAGHGRLDEWLDNPSLCKDGQLTDIPYPETDNYVKKIKAAIGRYGDIYGDILTQKGTERN